MIRAIAIDDEPKSLEVIKVHASKTKLVDLVETFTNPVSALEYLNSTQIDLIFLDIEMPDVSGINFAKAINKHRFAIIFITAHSEYAVDSYEVEAVDYLLKPFDFTRFLVAVRKAEQVLQMQSSPNADYLFVNTGTDVRKLWLNEILYIESDGNYVTYHTGTEEVIVRSSIKDTLRNLPRIFVQIHRSYIVPLDKIVKIQNNHAFVGSIKITIGANFRRALMKRVNQNSALKN
jgi:two-component system, LytTR family, response regulator